MGYSVEDSVHGREVNENGEVVNEGQPCCGRGEACYRGYNIIKGYYKRDAVNREAFDAEGWYHSGDIALFRQTARSRSSIGRRTSSSWRRASTSRRIK